MAIFKKTPNVLLEYLREEKCVLFVGSGISIVSGLPSWSNIINDIKSGLETSGRKNLDEFNFLQLAQFYEDIFGRTPLLNLLNKRIVKPSIEPNPCHDLIARLPVKTIVTTNWDDLVERTYEERNQIKPTTIWKDDQVGFGNEAHRPTIIKMHGCITDPNSIVFTEEDYLGYSQSHPLIVELLSTKLANSPMLFLGYSANDLDFKLVMERITSYLGKLTPPKYILLINETNEKAEYLDKRKFSPILINNKDLSKGEILENFLKELADNVAIYGYNKIDRAKILVRENKSQIRNASPSLTIRNSTNLGAWAIPEPEEGEAALFDLPDVDRLEWEASKIWDEFYQKGVKFKCIYCIDAQWMLKKYSPEHAAKRLRVFLDNLQKLDANQVLIVDKSAPSDYSVTIFDDDVLLQLTKATPDERTYTHAEVIRDKLAIVREKRIFDLHFEAIKEDNLERARKEGLYEGTKSMEQNLHKFVIQRAKKALKTVLQASQ